MLQETNKKAILKRMNDIEQHIDSNFSMDEMKEKLTD